MSTQIEPIEIAHPHIERREGVQGGRPVIRGTRFPVTSIVQNYRRGLSVDEMLQEFTHLTPAQVYDALSYYHDHRVQVDQEIAELLDIEQAMNENPPTIRPPDEAD